jgi:hydrogenase maturation protease
MPTLLIACGNTLRRDDGVAAEVLRLAGPTSDCETLAVQQLTPELAEQIARFERVVFLDADAVSTRLTIEPVSDTMTRSPLTHASTPAEIVALSTALFGFTGEALLCRIPAREFSPGDDLSPCARPAAQHAAGELNKILHTRVSALPNRSGR